ncbi:MAG: LamG domain-containing protein, partial [Opitutaceae bacterium]|nr:LamG domain-containing protein [Opitutaceae bacterium]
MKKNRNVILALAAAAAIMHTLPIQAADAPLYQWKFDADTGANTGNTSGGALSITNNANANVRFAGGYLDLTANVRGNASSSGYATLGSANIGTLNQYTITMWVKASELLGYQNLLSIGPNGTFGANDTDNTLTVRLNGGKLELYTKDTTAGAINNVATAPAFATNAWVFIAISYDGTSAKGSWSAAQVAATSGSAGERANCNMQLYIGDSVTGSTLFRTGVNWGQNDANYDVNKGPLALGTDASIFLGNRQNSQADRGFTGLMDDIRIYDTILSASEINAVRLEQLSSAIPEPGAAALWVGGAAASLAILAS